MAAKRQKKPSQSVPLHAVQDDCAGAPGATICNLLKEAATLHLAGKTWFEIAASVGRSHSAVSKWPRSYPERWTQYTIMAQQARQEALGERLAEHEEKLTIGVMEGGLEALTVLRTIMRGDIPRIPEASRANRSDLHEYGVKWDTAEGGTYYAVSPQLRESAAHSLLAAVQKLIAERAKQRDGVLVRHAGAHGDAIQVAQTSDQQRCEQLPPDERGERVKALLRALEGGKP